MLETAIENTTVEKLMRFDARAEMINGRIVPMMSVGYMPNRVAVRILISLNTHREKTKIGEAFSDGMGFAVPRLSSGRQSFSPDVSFYLGSPPHNLMRLIEAPPTFAVEVRSESDYGPGAELKMAAKRADYFEAGTRVVWDVDTEGRCVYCYRKPTPLVVETFLMGQIADAEPAVPGWRIDLNEIFRP